MKRTRVWLTEEEVDVLREMVICYQMNTKPHHVAWDRGIQIAKKLEQKCYKARARMAGMK